MTEYDYSPDAIERFQAKMAGVGKWASDQRYYAPGYSNPFQPADQASSSSRIRSSSRQNTYPEPRPRDRPQPTRSRTLPAGAESGSSPGHGQTSRAYAYAQQTDSRAAAARPSSSSRNHHRSGSQPADVRHAYPYPAQVAAPLPVAPGVHQVIQRVSPVTYAPPAPPGSRKIYKEYQYVPGQPIVLPQPRPGETFVIIPPKGGRVDVINDPRRPHPHSHSHSYSSGSGSKASSPTKGGNPLFKKILTNLKPSIEWGESSRSGRSSSRRDGSRRRSESR